VSAPFVPAIADTIARAGDLEVTRYFESWHEFYMMAGTAAVTLLGLLFVSLSFHLDVLLHESRAHLLQVARMAMMNFIAVLIISLFFLAPDMTTRPLGMNLVIISAVFSVFATGSLLRALRRHDVSRHSAFVLRRSLISVVGFLATGVVGYLMASRRDPNQAYWLIGCISMILGNAAGTAWDLLVRVGRLKQEIAANDSKS
jgi:hypothetical protein